MLEGTFKSKKENVNASYLERCILFSREGTSLSLLRPLLNGQVSFKDSELAPRGESATTTANYLLKMCKQS